MKDQIAGLFQIAGSMARRDGFTSPEDAEQMSRAELIADLNRQDKVIADLADRLGRIARRLSEATP